MLFKIYCKLFYMMDFNLFIQKQFPNILQTNILTCTFHCVRRRREFVYDDRRCPRGSHPANICTLDHPSIRTTRSPF